MISGFVILWTARGRTPLRFAVSRFLRLYPSFWLVVLLTVACIAALAPHGETPSFATITANLTMIPGYFRAEFVDGVYWTLAVELKFYFLVLVLIATRQMERVEWLLVAWLVALTICQASTPPGWLTSITMFPVGSLFAGGCVLSLVYSSGWTTLRSVSLLWALTLSCISAAPQTRGFIPDASQTAAVIAVVIQALCFLIMALIASHRLILRRVALATALGALTYPLYLLHNRIGKLIFVTIEPSVSPLIGVLLIGSLSFGLSWLMAEYVERRGLRWVNRTPLVQQLMT